jgi:hypothetical protein
MNSASPREKKSDIVEGAKKQVACEQSTAYVCYSLRVTLLSARVCECAWFLWHKSFSLIFHICCSAITANIKCWKKNYECFYEEEKNLKNGNVKVSFSHAV